MQPKLNYTSSLSSWLFRLVLLSALVMPSVALGWTVLPAASNLWVALGVTFSPLIPGWYASRAIHRWYYMSLAYRGLVTFTTVSCLTVKGYLEATERAQKQVTSQYIERFLSDENFQTTEMLELVTEKLKDDLPFPLSGSLLDEEE